MVTDMRKRAVNGKKWPHVVIIGGGFGGLYAARELARAPVRVTVIDRKNHHLFQPLLYQVATAGLNAGDIAYPIRSVLRRQKNAQVFLAEACAVNLEERRIILDSGEISYDFLIIATGATHSYFGNEQWAKLAPGLKSIEDALIIRRRVLLAYEAAEREIDPEAQREWLTFVIVGGGPTGVELAGALAEIGRHTLARDFRAVDPTLARVILIEGVDNVLPTYVPELRKKARAQLEGLGVEVRTGQLVTAIDEGGVSLGSERIAARTILWAAGVRASSLAKSLGVPLDRAGRVEVTEDLSLPGYPEVFVIGDLAAARSGDKPVPGVAQAAMQGGEHAARSIIADLEERPRRPFRYRDKGSLATVGRKKAVADLGHIKLSGFFAWIVWWLIHIMFLIGFKNRVLVLFQWAWSWLTFQRGARLITGSYGELPQIEEADQPALLPPHLTTTRVEAERPNVSG